MGIRHAKAPNPSRLSKTLQSFKHPKNFLISSKPNCAYICTITKELHSRATNKIPSLSTRQCKMVNTDHETLRASINVMPKGIFNFLKLTNLRKTNMLIEMADMTKKAPLGVVENVLVGIDKFLFPSDFVIIDRTPNETVILGRPFLTTIHAEIHVFDRKITLGVDNDRIIFDMDHNFTIPTERILMMNLVSNKGPSHTPGNPSSKQLKTDNSQDRQEQQVKKKLRLDEKIHVKHFCKPIIQTYNGKVKMWPTLKEKNMKGEELSFPDFLLVRYGGGQLNDSTWGQSYAEWYKENSHDNKPRPRDYSFKEWMIVKVGHTNVNESVKKALLKSWVIDCFEEALDPDKDPRGRSFDDYKWVFDLEIEQLADEYELGIGKKGHMLEMIWENCKNIQGKAKEWWYDYWLEEDEKLEMEIKNMIHLRFQQLGGNSRDRLEA
ncbi:phospholipase-like protein [Tanacetum coccineum]